MHKLVNKVGGLNRAISVIALLLAVPATVMLGPFAFIAAMSQGQIDSLETFFIFLLGYGGLLGIGGLWLRVFIQPSEEKSFSTSDLVTVLLFAGAASSLSVAASMVYLEGAASAMEMPLAFAFLGLGLIGISLAAQNLFANQILRRNVLKRALSENQLNQGA